MNKPTIVIFLMLFGTLPTKAALQDIIPQPRKIEARSNRQFYFRHPEKKIKVKIDPNLQLPSTEAYILETNPDQILIRAKSNQGVIWAKQTLMQLQTPTQNGVLFPDILITDYPEFPIRGFMLDNGRNFMEVPLIKHYLELLSRYKVNVFHWHLTDHPGWRIECKAYPQLNKPEFMIKGRDEGRFYTYNEIREVIRYAKTLGITIIPEIDMPGHSAFFEKAFGFKMGTPEGMKVLEACIKEFCREIPLKDCPYLHIGSDEVHIANPAEFMKWAEELTAKLGRKPIVWDPGLKASPGTIRQIWREGVVADTLSKDLDKPYIDSYMGYLNYYDPIVFTYRMMLHSTGKGSSNQGGILCLWNDVNATDKTKIASHNGFLNGLLPFAERFWSGTTAPFEGDPNVLPSPESATGKFIREFEQRMIVHRDTHLKDEPFYWVASSTLPWLISEPLPANADTTGVKWFKAWGGSIDLESFIKQTGQKPEARMKLYAKTRLYANSDTTIYAWIGFEAAARSNRLSGGIGKEGEWENKGEVYVNGNRVNPPRWKEPGAYAFHFPTWARPEEMIPYTDEQFYWMRSPVKISLKKGWNKIEVSAPKTFSGQRWSFSFTPLSVGTDGKIREVTGIKF